MLMLLQYLHAQPLNQMTQTLFLPAELGESLHSWLGPLLNAGLGSALWSHSSLRWRLKQQARTVQRGGLRPLACFITASRLLNKTWHLQIIKALDHDGPALTFLKLLICSSVWLLTLSVQLRHTRAHLVFVFLSCCGQPVIRLANSLTIWQK